MENGPVIVVIAFNRKESLIRLLHSLSKSVINDDVLLIISIDKGGTDEVFTIAEKFHWEYGSKEIIRQEDHLGLRNHIIQCGDLTEKYETVIILEDDLYVSPQFYEYCLQAYEYYKNDNNLAGISLYSMNFNMFTRFPFNPIDDGHDVFMLQIPQSWGQMWTRSQWSSFKNWYDEETDHFKKDNLPMMVSNWPSSSWGKYFYQYMINKNKFFVVPRVSLSTQFGEIGLHTKTKSNRFQTRLLLKHKNFNFISLDDSFSKYDSEYELLPETLNLLTEGLKDYDYTVDLNATKELSKLSTEYVLTTRECDKPIFSYALKMKPPIMNIIEDIKGNDIFLARPSDCKEIDKIEKLILNFGYFYITLSANKILQMLKYKTKQKIFRKK